MSYQVLARKWRPQNFKEMVGQEHVLRALVNALDSDRLHHAYLFTGTRGVGKTTIARVLAKCLNCETGVTSTPCGECNSCKEIAAGNFIDLIEVDAASRTKVEDTRELLENVQYAPTRARFKVYLIDEVHMLTGHSFNALLKTLEEPPAHVKFLFATTDPQKLPATILSRCLQFNLKRMPVDMIAGHLDYLLQQESIAFETSGLRLISRAADGSMRDALSLLDQAIAYSGADISESAVRDMLGTISHEPLVDLLKFVLSGEGKKLLSQVEDIASLNSDFDATTDALISLLHQVAIQQAVPASSNDEDSILELAQTMTKEEVQLFYQIALQGRRDLSLSPDPKCGFEMLLLRMMSFRPLREGMTLENSTTPNANVLDPVETEPQDEVASSHVSLNTSNDDTSLADNQLSHETKKKTLESDPNSVKSSISNKSSALSLADSLDNISFVSKEDTVKKAADNVSSESSQPSQSQDLLKKETAEINSNSSADVASSTLPKSSANITEPSQNKNNADIPPWEDIPPYLNEHYFDVDVDASAELSTANQTNVIIESATLSDIDSTPTEQNEVVEQPISERKIPDQNQPWHEVVPQLNLSGRANELIKHCLLQKNENGRVSLLLSKDSEGLLADTTTQEINTALNLLYGTNIQLDLRVADAPLNYEKDKSLETPAQRSDRKTLEIQQHAEKNIETDAFIIELQSRFGAQIVPGSVQVK